MRAQLPHRDCATSRSHSFLLLVALGLASVASPASGDEPAAAPATDAAAPPTDAEAPATAAEVPEASPRKISFVADVQPIFARHCVGCHQAAKPQGELVMTDFAALLSGGESGQAAIVPGDPAASYLIEQITPIDGVAAMPVDKAPLAAAEIETIRQWILAGAPNDSPAESGPTYTSENPPVYSRPQSIPSLDVAPDGKLLAVAGFHEVLLVDPADGQLSGRLVGLSERIESVRFSPDGQRLAVAGGHPAQQGEIQIWNVAERSLELSATFTHDTLRGVSWSPDGSMVAFGAADNAVRAIDAVTGEQRLFQGAHEDWVLGTAFTSAGDHVVSVARDMTCKLTETATERFIDNITSITPGALRGGLSSIVPLPGRDQIFVGGADGVAKIYRVFRQSARQIGDDANLLRQFPELPGRLFSVAVNGDATKFAAAATLDGRSEIRVWQMEIPTEVPEEIQAIQAKRVMARTAEEIQKLEAFLTPPPVELARLELDDTAVYAIDFLDADRLVIAGGDGQIRMLSASGQVERTFVAAPVSEAGPTATSLAFDPAAWAERVAEQAKQAAASDPATQETAPAADQIRSLQVSPESIELAGPFAYAQLAVTAELASGDRVDVTRTATLEAPPITSLTREGLARPAAAGEGVLRISIGEHQVSVPVRVALDTPNTLITPAGASPAAAVDFIRDVNPVLTRLGCNQGTCHGAQKGKNGFKLSLRGYDPRFDIRALTDDLASRRINLASPNDSLMLLKALGRVPHQGGALVTAGSPQHGILQSWIAQGASLNMNSSRAERIEILPQKPTISKAGQRQQVRVVAHYEDGSTRDVTHEAFVESGNTEVATASTSGVLTSLRRGEAAILARYEGNYTATTLTVMGDREGFAWQEPETYSEIDRLVAAKWERMKIIPSELCDDATFLRRVYLDLTGLPPTADQVRAFLADATPTRQKRDAVVDALIGSPEYVQYWTNKWADLLQVNRKFLGAEGAAQFRQWIEQAVAENRPYDEFASQVLTSTGSNKANPAASYYKILRTPEETMENTTHLFLGIRFNCNKCHDHPFERWTQDQYYETASFFARTSLRPDPAGGDAKIGGSAVEGAKPLYEEVFDAAEGELLHPQTNAPVEPAFPYECDFTASEDATRRERLAAWITSADNPYFARSYANRVWGYLTGVGLIEPVDDIRAGNPPTNPELLDYLTEEFISSGFDARHLMRLICTSRVYQLSVATNQWNADDRLNYSHAQPRRLPAEVLYDAIHRVTGSETEIPGVPAGTRAAALPDAGVELADGFLANLGRPVRESACECERSSDLQLGPIMALVSGPTVGKAISDEANDLPEIVTAIEDDAALVDELFLRILNRPPSPPELEAFRQTLDSIDDDHRLLADRLAEREAWWAKELPRREQAQQASIAEAKQKLADLLAEIAPEQERLANEREARIAAAEAGLKTAREQLQERSKKWETDHQAATEWWPLKPTALAASSGAKLQLAADRSISASGNKDKGTYTITVDTRLDGIRGFRLETLPVPELPGGGPGFPTNGNFVVTEFEVTAAPLSDPSKAVAVKIESGKADFTQDSFGIEQAFDEVRDDQRGWAVSPTGGVVHWATFKLAEPIAHAEGTRLTFTIHQFHNAAEHRLARFRLSATTDDGPLPLGMSESLAASLSVPAADRSEADLKPLLDYLEKTDAGIREANATLAAARAPVPKDPRVTAIERSIEELSAPLPLDAALAGLRSDFEQSQEQLKNLRLTAAEDLTWALINSPAFLFNR
ncbi:DUF1549 domain-containing protein [Candidatus Laterigemmans baculatus]|uniref:DUF1549 domain-containing protein n=1 Tax=Candidatus Laterigemmans baculatus TaxID=2770505 RepID=UPI0013DC59C1|nr:DUF1549 domain-containing protein [Candidatus Laterigemmans baculatus]